MTDKHKFSLSIMRTFDSYTEQDWALAMCHAGPVPLSTYFKAFPEEKIIWDMNLLFEKKRQEKEPWRPRLNIPGLLDPQYAEKQARLKRRAFLEAGLIGYTEAVRPVEPMKRFLGNLVIDGKLIDMRGFYERT